MLKGYKINSSVNLENKEKIAEIIAILLAFMYNLISFLLLLISSENINKA